MRGGGSPISKSKCQNSDKILTFLVTTKNDPYGLKCKINPKNFFSSKGFPKGAGGGVGPPFGKNSQKIPFFLNESPPKMETKIWANMLLFESNLQEKKPVRICSLVGASQGVGRNNSLAKQHGTLVHP